MIHATDTLISEQRLQQIQRPQHLVRLTILSSFVLWVVLCMSNTDFKRNRLGPEDKGLVDMG